MGPDTEKFVAGGADTVLPKPLNLDGLEAWLRTRP
jgi:hypothetical protein